ncbi:hypothetical protein PSYMO_04588, partial [Pseudomonas amygdali pv. mori str. 301020]
RSLGLQVHFRRDRSRNNRIGFGLGHRRVLSITTTQKHNDKQSQTAKNIHRQKVRQDSGK